MSKDIKNRFYTYLQKYDLKESTQNWYIFNCPFCGDYKNKCAVNIDYEVVKCWKCGYKNSIISFISTIEKIDENRVISYVKKLPKSNRYNHRNIGRDSYRSKNITLPKGFVPLLDGTGVIAKRARKYLISRNLDLDYLDSIGVGYVRDSDSDFFGYIIFPFKVNGTLQYYIGRDFIGNFLRYKNPKTELFNVGKSELFFNEDALSSFTEVNLLEGLIDAVTMGINSISSQGWLLSSSQKNKLITSPVEKITIITDAGVDNNGVSFYNHGIKLAMELVEYKKVRVIDLNGLDGKDPNELGCLVVNDLIEKTPYMNFIELLNKNLS